MTGGEARGLQDEAEGRQHRIHEELAAILFRAARVVPVEELTEHFGVTAEVLGALVEELRRKLNPLGLEIAYVAGGYKLVTHPRVYHSLRSFFSEVRESGLTPQALEVLAIIAYRQPITRARIEGLRGVGSESTLHSLLARGLIKIRGRVNLPGRPFLYATTSRFLETFSLASLEDLPKRDLDFMEALTEQTESG